jgi:FAD:protein FMN transferase
MQKTKILMGMPITIQIIDSKVSEEHLDLVFNYFKQVDQKFSTYKKDSEITMINEGKIRQEDASSEMTEILRLCEETKKATNEYFNIEHNGKLDPSGLVKGWAINNAARMLGKMGYTNFYVEAGGDIQTAGTNKTGKPWVIGIRNPFNREENVKIIKASNKGVATSGTYIRGQHVYNPKKPGDNLAEVVSLTVIGENIYEADRMATAAFAMGRDGINFIARLPKMAGYMIDKDARATFTPNFDQYTK